MRRLGVSFILFLLIHLLLALPMFVSGAFANSLLGESTTVIPSKSLVYIGQYDYALLYVNLRDTSDRPFGGHTISVHSSRIDDVVRPYERGVSTTDANGMIAFAVTSTKIGFSDYLVFDETLAQIVGSSVRITYLDASRTTPAVGGDPLAVASPQSVIEAGPAESFKFEDLPTNIPTNQPVDFTVTAFDVNKKVAVGYLGTVHFSAIGDNGVFVSLPKDYTYLGDDLGKHVFPLSLVFQQEGTYLLQVTDTKKSEIIGSTSVTVKGGSAATSGSSNAVTIATPSPGSYSTSVQILTGLAPSGKDVKFFDNDREIGSTVAKVDGTFTFTTSALPDGAHKFFARSVDQKGLTLGTSADVSVIIDTQPPVIESATVTPAFDVSTGQLVQLELLTEGKLKKAFLDVGGIVTELSEDLEKYGLYHASFAAPEKEGEYSLKFTLSDPLGNESVLTYETKLTVHIAGQVSAVRNFKAFPKSYRADLQWATPERGVTNIDHYRIYFGTDPDNLTQKMDTADASLRWYVPNLKNDLEYYFGIVAVDKQGYLGEAGTLVVATPREDGVLGGFPVADSYISSRYLRGETGPAIFWLLPLSFGAYRLLRRKISK